MEMSLKEYVSNIIGRVKKEYEGTDKNVISALCMYWHNVGYSYSNISNVSDKDFRNEVLQQIKSV